MYFSYFFRRLQHNKELKNHDPTHSIKSIFCAAKILQKLYICKFLLIFLPSEMQFRDY